MKVLVVYYSLYGHVRKMAEAVAEGAQEVPGAMVAIKRVPETLPPEVIEKMGAAEIQRELVKVPEVKVEDLSEADVIFFGTPTRFGNMCGQMRQFLDATGGLWAQGALVGKVGSVFVSTGTQHGGQELTIASFHTTLLHQGMVIVGLPYTFQGQTANDQIVGGSPYGATTIAGTDGSRQPGEIDLAGARFQGRHAASIGAKLFG